MRLALLRVVLAIVHWLEAPERRAEEVAEAEWQRQVDEAVEAEMATVGLQGIEARDGAIHGSLSQKERGLLLSMAEAYYGILKQQGGVNFWEVTMCPRLGSGIPDLVLSISRKDGYTPGTKSRALEQSLEELLADWRRWRDCPSRASRQALNEAAARSERLLETINKAKPEPEKFDMAERLRSYGLSDEEINNAN